MTRRTLKDIEEWLNPEQIYELITAKSWTYKETPEFYHTRDKALMAVYFLTGARNNEVLRLRKKDFDQTTHVKFIVIKSMHVSKRTKKTIKRFGPKVTRRENIKLPLFKTLMPFTLLVLNHLDQIEDKDRLFPFGIRRSHQIIKHITGMWVHWFRAMSENYYGSVFRDVRQLAKFIGVTDVQSVMSYIPFDEAKYEKDLLERT